MPATEHHHRLLDAAHDGTPVWVDGVKQHISASLAAVFLPAAVILGPKAQRATFEPPVPEHVWGVTEAEALDAWTNGEMLWLNTGPVIPYQLMAARLERLPGGTVFLNGCALEAFSLTEPPSAKPATPPFAWGITWEEAQQALTDRATVWIDIPHRSGRGTALTLYNHPDRKSLNGYPIDRVSLVAPPEDKETGR